MMNGDASREVSFREREKPDQDGSEPAGDHQEDDLKWSCVRGEEASPEWSQSSSGPSSEGEEGEGESRTPSGYTLLPQDPEQINGYATGGGGAAPPEQDPEGSPRMTKWLQKQLKDMTVSTSTNTSSKTQTEHSTTDWAKFSEPVVSSESKDWPNVAIEERTTGATMTTGPVEPVSTMGEAEVAAIKEAMTGFSLPTSATPSWAQTVPESVWKAELIGGLQPKKKKHKNK